MRMCNDTLSCNEQCKETKHFCSMWIEHSDEVITIVEDPSIIVSNTHPIYGIGIMYDDN